MREIKFRAWDKKKKQMLVAGQFSITSFGTTFKTNTDGEQELLPDLEVLSYTNLKDKNGKEIYEGDIVKGAMQIPQLLTWQNDENSNITMAGEVFYDHSGFSLKAVQSMCDPERDGMVNYFDFISDDGATFEHMEIIGNIYENPELITN